MVTLSILHLRPIRLAWSTRPVQMDSGGLSVRRQIMGLGANLVLINPALLLERVTVFWPPVRRPGLP